MDAATDPLSGDPDLLTRREIREVGLLTRVRSSVAGRRLVPTPVALALTRAVYGGATKYRKASLARAEAEVDAVVGNTSWSGDLARLAVAQRVSAASAWELTWRPWELTRIPVSGLEHLQAARAAGRGQLLSYVHYGPELGWVALGPHATVLTPLGDWIVEEPPPGYNGLQVEQRRELLKDAGLRLIHAENSARSIMRALNAGGAVLLAMDLPGSRVTQFLGKPVEMADGTARLAHATKSLVIPTSLVPEGRGWRLVLRPALDPADFAKATDLHQSLADLHSEAILEAPEHYGSPLRPGMWGHATRDGWTVQ